MTDTPRCDLIAHGISTKALAIILELAQTLERELAAMEYRCGMAEGEELCLGAAVERLRREVAWLRGGGSLVNQDGVIAFSTYYDALDEVEAHLASSPPDDFKPKLTTDKS